MPVPAFNEHGFLPPGVHDCTMDEIRVRFGSFQGTDRRAQLFAKLMTVHSEAKVAGIVRAIIVDGSFVTAKPDPNDIDLVIVVASDHDLAADLGPAAYNIISKKHVQRRFGFDMVAVREGTLEYDDATTFFQHVRRQPALRKGILWVGL
jgi:hypothetical protein